MITSHENQEFERDMYCKRSLSEQYGGPWVSRHNHISHGTTKYLTAQPKTLTAQPKTLTAQPNISRHNQISHGTTKNSHGKIK